MMKTLLPLLTTLFVANNSNASITNGDFEQFPVNPGDHEVFLNNAYSGWVSTTNELQIWGTGYRGIPSYDGYRFITLPMSVGIYQEISMVSGEMHDWSFAHRPRANTDVLNFKITDLGLDEVSGTFDDVLLYTQNFSDQLPRWTNYSGIFASLTDKVKIEFTSIDTTSGKNGNNTMGNYIDSVKINSIPSPGAVFILIVAGLFLQRRR